MSASAGTDSAVAALREGCRGVVELPARLAPWQVDTLQRPDEMRGWLEDHGSPVNVLDTSALGHHAEELCTAARAHGLALDVYFARKANKALSFVAEAHRLGLGIDLASERELQQVLDLGLPGSALVMTAAVKPEALLWRCVASHTTIVIDNADELRRLNRVAADAAGPVPVALRLAPDLDDGTPPTRFGLTHEEALAAAADLGAALRLDGVHFHVDGYLAAHRSTAIARSLHLVDALRVRGHAPSFIDIGGGIPMSYLSDRCPWEHFWAEHEHALFGRREPLTFGGHGLGLSAHAGKISGRRAVYPSYQQPVRGAWLSDVLTTTHQDGTIGSALVQRGLTLHCEPGRALLDGCGLTVARVAHRKQRADGTWLISLEMNRTQCRSAAEDFLVDPLLVRPTPIGHAEEPTGAIEGYLVGAYCIERELLSWRRLHFPRGVAVGDLLIFPNTAGYLMHILESSSHQIPLARNLVRQSDGTITLDAIDTRPGA